MKKLKSERLKHGRKYDAHLKETERKYAKWEERKINGNKFQTERGRRL
jgi:hypothetical protein